MITALVDYLNNNLLIAHYCSFDISLPLPSYWTFVRFLKNFHPDSLSAIMRSQVLSLSKKGVINTSFIGMDSTPVSANTSQNNPKSFLINLTLITCPLQIRTASLVSILLPIG